MNKFFLGFFLLSIALLPSCQFAISVGLVLDPSYTTYEENYEPPTSLYHGQPDSTQAEEVFLSL
mgnify:CR=1 FL=1